MATQYYTSVQEAIQKGKLNLKIIPRAIAYICIGASSIYYFFEFIKFAQQQKPFDFKMIYWSAGISLAGLFAAFLWRSFHSAAWKIWALQNVQDVHRLYQVANQQVMISKRGSWLNFFEFKTTEQKQQLLALEARFDQPREMEGVSTPFLPEERIFPYSKKMLLLQLAMVIPFIVVVKLVFHESGFFPAAPVLLFFLGVTLIRWVPRFKKPAPLRLNKEGIILKALPLIPWKDIHNIALETRQYGKSSTTVLVIESLSNPKPDELDISEIEGQNDEIEQAVYDFWIKYR